MAVQRSQFRMIGPCALAVLVAIAPTLRAQVVTAASVAQPASAPAAGPPAVITLDEAIRRAQQSEPGFASAHADQRSAAIDHSLAQAALLPSATYHNQVLYTQPNGQRNQAGQIGSQAAPIFIANNAIREYASQASINETIGLKEVADVKIAAANAARASAELEIARRGLVSAVVELYYGVSDADARQQLMTRALQEAQDFTHVTGQREAAREVAHADVVKAELAEQQRERDLSDANTTAEKARLDLGVLLFPDPRTPYLTQPASAESPLPARSNFYAAASAKNPEVQSALAAFEASNAAVDAAKAAYLPDLGLNFSYGIDAPQFARYGPNGVNNLGYSISGTLDIPVWDWLSTEKRIKQSEIRRDAAQVTVTAAQRRLIAELEEAYTEASAAHDQLSLLDQSVQTAAENLRLTNLRYSAGESPALEVVDAQNSSIAAETAQADGLVRYQAALANLELLTGQL